MLRKEHTFKLSQNFVAQFRGQQPDWGPLGYVTYKRTYARPVPGEGSRTEEYWETLRRVVEGCYTIQINHCRALHLPWDTRKAQASAQEMYKLMWGFKFLPPGRGLWMMGTDYIWERGSAALNNCAFVSTADLRQSFSDPFCFLMDMSMLGVGVAFDTTGAGSVDIVQPQVRAGAFVVEDSKDGWVDLVRHILEAYVGRGMRYADVDYSMIRPAGSVIASFGGVAPGSAPLEECISNIDVIMADYVGRALTSVGIVDLMNVIGKCVVSGGVRRTAELALGSPDDEDYLTMKGAATNGTPASSWRWASNNSVVATVGMDYTRTAAQVADGGEPGYFWLDNARAYGRLVDGATWADRKACGTNPCAEQTLESFEICNLVETFPSRHATYEEYERTLKFAYLYAKTVTLVPTHNERTNAIMLRNRRIGLSQSGIIESFERHGRHVHLRWCDKGYEYLTALDKVYSDWLCIPTSIKRTSVKPSGTVSLLPGVTPGIHYPHAEYYWRTIRLDRGSALLNPLSDAGYRIEDSECGDNTKVVYFPVKHATGTATKGTVSIWEQVQNVAAMQYWWADNQVSVTVTFTRDEAAQIPHVLECMEQFLKGISFLPSEDHGYVQAPYQTMTEADYAQAVAGLRPVDFGCANTDEVVDAGCDGESCTV